MSWPWKGLAVPKLITPNEMIYEKKLIAINKAKIIMIFNFANRESFFLQNSVLFYIKSSFTEKLKE